MRQPDEQAALLRAAHSRIKDLPPGAVNDEQFAWLRDLSRLACLTMVQQGVPSADDCDGIYDDENHITNSFAVLWDDTDYLGEYFYEFMNDQWNNTGAPRLRIMIRNREDIKRTRIILRTFSMAQKVFYYLPEF